ncbi:hypothetical protein [Bacillus infantis]|jgi:hypothetical protein|uniref:hypothetical protein n=1 Tax=Bacillus infantis TaxID=324767 RepID=UPI0021553426|nr:hypothetical protein [Bacillus infantis]MCR6609645.1 hypothetical protein [Bacillus infantis]
MDQRIKKFADSVFEKYGLKKYYLGRTAFYQNSPFQNKTDYTLSMEWFPDGAAAEDDGSNPEGTAVIEVAIPGGSTKSAIFVGGKTLADGVIFVPGDRGSMIDWIERETGLSYGQQFMVTKEEDRRLHFSAAVNGTSLYPGGHMELEVDDEGRLITFSAYGYVPEAGQVQEDNYALSLEDIDEDILKEQLVFARFPNQEKEKWYSLFAIEEIFITNDRQKTIEFDPMGMEPKLTVDQVIEWDKPSDVPFERKPITAFEDISADQAFAGEHHIESYPIREAEADKCAAAIRQVLSREYPSESGQWTLKTLRRSRGCIDAVLRKSGQDFSVFKRKLTVVIDAHSFEPRNYIDNQMMLDMFDGYQAPGETAVVKAEAFEKLKSYFFLKPVYVYDVEKEKYVLCGKLDCRHAVDAETGKIVLLDDI